jgi:two-component system sensor histidine kinase QseC
MDKISPCLWFNGQAEAAMNFYLSVFKRSRCTNILRWGEGGHGVPGSVLLATFELEGQTFSALNGGPQYQFTPAISLFVNCEDQAEVDEVWGKLVAAGGQPVQCGWITDHYGVSWQIVPRQAMTLMHDPDPDKAARVFQAMLPMIKLDLAVLQRAYEQS